ncbi:hypothetical protein PG984_008127 [Apiospora sp. TS-2023a]
MADPAKLGKTGAAWKNQRREENWSWSQYRTQGRYPDNVPAFVQQQYQTPFARGANQNSPLLTGIRRTDVSYQHTLLLRPNAVPPSQALRQRIAAIRNRFEVRPRFNYRRLLGAGGEGVALKMTYQPRNNNLQPLDFVLKTPINASTPESDRLRKEARMMEKVKRSAHCVQIIHSSGRPAADFELPNGDDSSDDPDADSSGDDSVDEEPPEPVKRKDRTAPRKRAATNRANQKWQRVVNLRAARYLRQQAIAQAAQNQRPRPAENPNYPDAALELNRRDFIFMEYLPCGDLDSMISKIVEDDPDMLIPNEILWSFWLCCRDRVAGQPRPTMDKDLKRLGIVAPDPNQVLLEDLPLPRKDWRKQRMVHFDIDPSNRAAQHPYTYDVQRDVNDVALPANVVPPGGEPPIPRRIDIDMVNAVGDYDEPSEHDLIPALKEQFCPDWNYIGLDRDGDEVCEEPVAGNYGSHSNVWQIAMVMWQLITYGLSPTPPRLVTSEIVRGRPHRSYALLLDQPQYRDVDVQLRQTVVNCLKHNPEDRPKLGVLLDQAKRAVARRRRDATAGEIRGWVQSCHTLATTLGVVYYPLRIDIIIIMAVPMTAAEKQEYEDNVRLDNARWQQYRILGEWPRRDDPAIQNMKNRTPRVRTGATQAPVTAGIAGAVGYTPEEATRPPPSKPDAEERRMRREAERTTLRAFDLPPRYRYRRLLGRGGARDGPQDDVHPAQQLRGGADRFHTLLTYYSPEQKVKRGAHTVQILHSSGPARYEVVDMMDSSDDALSSEDEETLLPRRPPQPPRTQAQKRAAHTARYQLQRDKRTRRNRRIDAIGAARDAQLPKPPEDPNHPDLDLEVDRHDFIFMEFMPLGSLKDTLHRVADEWPNNPPIPNKILWSFWLCMLRACIGMAFPPRKFHPDRNRGAQDRRNNMSRGIGVAANFNPDDLLLEEIPPMRQRTRRKRMVHMDIDAGNTVFLGEARDYAYDRNRLVPNYNDPPVNTVTPVPDQIDIAMEDGFPNQDKAAEHGDMPIIKVNFPRMIHGGLPTRMLLVTDNNPST